MGDFIRARSTEQKLLRMNEIMKVTDKLFVSHTYHEITLTSIAQELNWSRGNLYKYVTTKEEIFLELYLEKQRAYLNDVKKISVNENKLSDEEFAEIWTKILLRHNSFLNYYSILVNIIETNVTVERLAIFKKNAYIEIEEIIKILENHGNLSNKQASKLFNALLFHAVGLNSGCNINPLVKEAIALAGLPEFKIDFFHDFKEFMLLCMRGLRTQGY